MPNEQPELMSELSPPSTRGSLAKRWANWAANLFVSGVLIVVGLVFGREVLHWWYVESPELTSGQAASGIGRKSPSGDSRDAGDEANAEIQFADLPVVFRHGSSSGEFSAALAQMQQQCVQTAQAASAQRPDRVPGTAEAKLLEELAASPADAKVAGVGEMFVRERPVPMAVVLSGDQTTLIRDRRVLAWGILFPSQSESGESTGWGWFTWRPTDSGPTGGGNGSIRVPTLPSGRRTLAMRLESGELRVGYAGQASSARWREAFDAWFSRDGWGPAEGRPWEEGDRVWARRYVRSDARQTPTQSVAAAATGAGEPLRAEILIREEPSGQLQAFLIMSPAVAAQ